MNLKYEMAAELRRLRLDMELHQQDLADELGVSRKTLSWWENAHTPVPAYMFEAVRRMNCALKNENLER